MLATVRETNKRTFPFPPTSLPHPSTSVGPERSDTAHIAAPSLRSHHWRCRQSSLATSVGMKGSSSRSPCGLTERCVVMLRSTCNSSRAPPTSLLGTDSGPQSPTVCSFLLSDFLLSVVAPSLSLVLVYGMIYRRTLPPHRRCSHLKQRLKTALKTIIPTVSAIRLLCGPCSSCLLFRQR